MSRRTGLLTGDDMGIIFNRRPKASAQFERRQDNRTIPRWTSPPSKNTLEWMAAFTSNPRMAVIDKISSDLSYVPGTLYRKLLDGSKEKIESHPFLDFMDQPNPLYEFTASALWRLQSNYLLLKGEGYFIIERNSRGEPAELWPVPTQWVQMTPYQGFPYYTVRTTDGSIMEVSVDDMFVMKDLNPVDPYKRGLGQAEPIADEIEIDEYAAKFQKKFFFNDATPNLIVSMPGANPDQENRFLAKWKERFMGANNSHGVATVAGPADRKVDVIKLADNMKDLDMINGRTFARDAVLEHFGMPREIMGITQNSNRATAEAAQFIYAKNVLTPRLKARQDAINRQLLPDFGDDLIWEYDDIIPDDKEFEKGVAMEGWNNGVVLLNEAREKIGLEPTKNGNIYKMGFADMFIGENENRVELSTESANLQFVTEPDPIEADRESIEITSEEKILKRAEEIKAKRIQSAGRSLQHARMEQERKFEAATSRYFKNQRKQIFNSLQGTQKANGSIWDKIDMTPEEFELLSQDQQQDIVNQFVNGLTDWKKEADLLESLFTPLWAETYDKGVENIKNSYKLTDVQQPALVSTARLRGGQRIARINQTTKDSVGRIITDGLITGKNHQDLTNDIMKEMNTSASRARTIAAQECNTSLLAGNYDMARQGGFSMKTWHYTNASKARDTHRDLNGKTVPITEPFVTNKGNKLMMPCDPDCNVAEETVNCHCFLTYS